MSATEIRAAGTTASNSSSVTVAAGSCVRLSLFKSGQAAGHDRGIPIGTVVPVQTQVNGAWYDASNGSIGLPCWLQLTNEVPDLLITAPGVYRLAFPDTSAAIGGQSDT